MEELTIQKGKKIKYVFSFDKIVIIKNDKIKKEVKLCDVAEIFYNPKLRFRDVLDFIMFNWMLGYQLHPPKSFDISLKGKCEKVIRLWLSPDEYKQVIQILNVKEIGINSNWI